ncbi:MAG TPA: glutamine-hydrolyzing GMP synthase, partial [Thermoanaerobaculia bacterium]|nr:glutamine-hydrolyzing GMP synthase [Thermoanaerobaculia bacterium]
MQPDQTVLVLDFGSQYTQLIARRIRDNSVFSVVHPYDLSLDKIRALAPKAIVLSGGPQSVYSEAAPHCSREVFALGVPILAICYGMQLAAYLLDGNVEAVTEREYGRAEIDVIADSRLFANTPRHQRVWASHGDSILKEPPGFRVIASSSSAPIAAFENAERAFYAIQFHPEVTHSEAGAQIIRNFLFDIAGCTPTWDLGDFRRRKVDEIRREVGDRHVIAAVSGGVDSSVAALLVAEAIGDQLTAIFVDNGVLRKNEALQVMSRLSDGLGMHIIAVDARDRFYEKLAGIEDPETKR